MRWFGIPEAAPIVDDGELAEMSAGIDENIVEIGEKSGSENGVQRDANTGSLHQPYAETSGAELIERAPDQSPRAVTSGMRRYRHASVDRWNVQPGRLRLLDMDAAVADFGEVAEVGDYQLSISGVGKW